MKHALRKYLAPCGSALFMVISTMAALVVLCTAMYLSVVSSGKVQYATFNEEQAYITSTSVADILSAYITDSSHSSSSFVENILKLKTGESIETTNGNGFLSLGAAEGSGLDDTALGGYSAKITKLADETEDSTTWHVIDIAVTASKSGVMETTHTYLRYKDAEPTKVNDIDRFFTATGYVPNDIIVANGVFTSTMYFDAEFTKISRTVNSDETGDEGSACRLNADMICAGTVMFEHEQATVNNPIYSERKDDLSTEPLSWYIGGDLVFKGKQPDDFQYMSQNGKNGLIIVGGDLDLRGTTNRSFKGVDIYVLGDCYIGEGLLQDVGNLYVAGDVIYSIGINQWGGISAWQPKVNMYVNGEVKTAGDGYHVVFDGSMDDAAIAKIKAMGTWNDNTDAEYTVSAAKEKLDTKIGGSVYPKWNITAPADTVNIHFDDYNTSNEYIYYINEDCKIGKITAAGNNHYRKFIIIDTGEEGDVRTIQLTDNGDGYFSWCAKPKGDGQTQTFGVNVLTIGQGTLVIDIPDDVIYHASYAQEFVGHMGWYKLLDATVEGYNYEKVPNVVKGYIHNSEDCTTCTYTTKTVNGETQYYCEKHKISFDTNPNGSCICDGVVDKEAAKSSGKLSDITIPGANLVNYSGDLTITTDQLLPNVNIYLESCSESADIRLADGTRDSENSILFGYVYAPYMTYVDMSTGGGTKCVGGLIVSDYIICGSYAYYYARPDQNISDIAGENFEVLNPTASREWRIYGA